MISVGILDGARPIEARRRGPRYSFLTLIVAVCLTVFTSSYLFHGSQNQQSSDVEKRSTSNELFGLNNSLVSLPRELASPGLVTRTASQELWDRKVLSGRRSGLWCMMHSDNVQAGTVTLDVLKSTGWVEDTDPSDHFINDFHKSLGPTDGRINKNNEFARVWDHDNSWIDGDGRKRGATTASMGNIVNGIDGYIIAGANFGPQDSALEMPEWERPSTKWTDIMEVQWNQYVAGSALNRVYRSNIAYPETKDLIESALKKIEQSDDVADLPLWPGIDFMPGEKPQEMPMTAATEAFMGLLGSSHGAGPAYLVIQYRAIFGRKEISKIKNWKVEGKPSANMLIYMQDIA